MIICEVGLNHLGDEAYANEYIDRFLQTDADAITFQIIKDSVFEDQRFKHLKLERDFFRRAFSRVLAERKKIGAAVDDEHALEFLEEIGASFYKVLSKDINNTALVDKLLQQTQKQVFISTGMSDLEEIEACYERVKKWKGRVAFVHTQLSNEIADVNLNAIPFLRERFGIPVAFGMHCSKLETLYLAQGYEPSDIFFYIKGSRAGHPDDDHAVSLANLAAMTKNLTELPQAIGHEVKVKMKDWAAG